jgi:uncharacterized protein
MTLRIADNLTLPLEAVTRTFSIIAMKGVGKTHTGVVMTEEMLKAGQIVVAVDPLGVWWGLRSSKNGKTEGFPVVIFGGEHADAPLEEQSGEIIAQAIVEQNFSAVLDLSMLRKGAQVRFMTQFAETLYRLSRRPLHLMVDEADAFAPQRPMKGEERLLGSFEDIVRRGRARGLGVTLITQRAAVINKNVLTQTEVLVCLRVLAPQDRQAVHAWIEAHGTEKQKGAFDDSLASLPLGEAWFWSPGWLEIFKRVKVRERETFDSSMTPKVGEVAAKPKTLAAVDIARLGEQINATVQRQKENDPAELRRQVANLKRQLASRPVPKIERIEVPVFDDKDRSLIERATTGFERLQETVEKKVDELRGIYRELNTLRAMLNQSGKPLVGSVPDAASSFTPQYAPDIAGVPDGVGWKPTTRPATNGSLPKGELKVLTAIAQHPIGATREQLTILSGYKRSSRDVYLQRLAQKKYIHTAGDMIQVTDEGRAVLGKDFAPLPTGEALREHWLAKLPAGEKRLLQCLVLAYPKTMTRDYLSEQTGYKRSSRDVYLQRLAARKLVQFPMAGEARASQELFNE